MSDREPNPEPEAERGARGYITHSFGHAVTEREREREREREGGAPRSIRESDAESAKRGRATRSVLKK